MSYSTYVRKNAAVPAANPKAVSKNASSPWRISALNDAFEREADRAADAIMARGRTGLEWSHSQISVTPSETTSKAVGSEMPSIVREVLSTPGQPLDPSTRAYFEPRFAYDFSRVRVHTDEPAAKSAQAVQASAYTVGRDIVFGAGKYMPETNEGRRLLAHEIVHTLQQGIVAGSTTARQLEVSQPGDAAEQEAARIAASVTSGAEYGVAGPPRRPVSIGRSPQSIQRDIVGSQDLPTGKFEVNFKKHEAVVDAVDAGVDLEGAKAGERGAMTFTPKASAPQSHQIRFLQAARLTETASGELHQFIGPQAPLNEMRSQPGEYAEGGFFVDVQPTPASRRTRKSDLSMEPFYNQVDQFGQSRVTKGNKTGFNWGGDVSPVILEDHPRSFNPVKYEFISTAKDADTGAWYGSVFWGFEIFIDQRKAKIRNENLRFSEWEGRDTSKAAVKAFDEYYRNPGAASEPKIP
jgi:Domain of unknown function (DUF4157)